MFVVDPDMDGLVVCGWLEEGEVQVAHLPAEVLESVSATGEEQAWRQAFHDSGQVLEYLRKRRGL
ncbi:MAG: hypothetical protein K0R58_218, partial [Ramlibacter sp.]|jgi:hypothetical protein|nr:hypothetical protein [Ramlibacter sp.]